MDFRVLVYKRTHTGDPNANGFFGVHDCMGKIRNSQFNAVIGIGVKNPSQNSKGIAGKITWVGINPIKSTSCKNYRGQIIEFKKFILLDEKGPSFKKFAPVLSTRFYNRQARYIISNYSDEEKNEISCIIDLFSALYDSKKFKRCNKLYISSSIKKSHLLKKRITIHKNFLSRSNGLKAFKLRKQSYKYCKKQCCI